MEGDAVEGPVVCISIEVVLLAVNEMSTGRAPGPSVISLKLIAASRGIGIQVMAEICQRVLDGFGMPRQIGSMYSGPYLLGVGWYQVLKLLGNCETS